MRAVGVLPDSFVMRLVQLPRVAKELAPSPPPVLRGTEVV